MKVLQMSISGSVLILLTLAIRALAINRLPKKTFLALWGIALCRLMMPLTIPSRFSVYNLVNHIHLYMAQRPVVLDGSYLGRKENVAYGNIDNRITDTSLQVEPLMLVWIIGGVLLAIFFMVTFYKCHKEMRTALPVGKSVVIESWFYEQKTFRSMRVLLSDKITTPLVWGILNPKIILPKSLDYDNELQMQHILTHELIHIKHFDALWKFVLITVLCFHWFNPLVWVLYALVNRDIELVCDERAIKLLGNDTRFAYAMSLINMAEQKTKFTPLYNGFSKNAAEERIVAIMKTKKWSLRRKALGITLTFCMLAVFTTTTLANLTVSADAAKQNVTSETSGKTEGNSGIKEVFLDSYYKKDTAASLDAGQQNVTSERVSNVSNLNSEIKEVFLDSYYESTDNKATASGGVGTYAVYSINWTISAYSSSYGVSQLSMTKGNTIPYNISWTPQPGVVRVGLFNRNTSSYYWAASSTSSPLSGTITVPATGLYSFAVGNTTDTQITATGTFTY